MSLNVQDDDKYPFPLVDTDFVGKLFAYRERRLTAVNQAVLYIGSRPVNWRDNTQTSILKAYASLQVDFAYLDDSRMITLEVMRETIHSLQAQLRELINRTESGIVKEQDELQAMLAKGLSIQERIIELSEYIALFEDGNDEHNNSKS